MKNLFKPTILLRKKLIFTGLLASLMVTFVASCSKFEESIDFNRIAEPEWNPDLAMPLINSKLILQDFFPDSAVDFFRINEDSSISLVYNGKQLFSRSAEEMIRIPDQDHQIPALISLPDVPTGFLDSLDIPLSFQVITDDNGQRIDSLMMKSGALVLGGNCNLNMENVALRMIFPGLQKKSNGEMLIINFDLSNPGGQQQEINFTQTVDFAEYKMVFDNQSATEPNMLNFILRFVVEGDENPNLSPYTFQFDYSMTDILFSSIYGYFGNLELGFSDSIQITAFDKNIAGGIEVGQEAINIIIDVANSMGLPIKFNATEIWFYSPVNEPYYTDIFMYGPGVENSFVIAAPDITQVGQIARTHLDFRNNNIEEAFKIAPQLFYYNFDCVTNPENNPENTNFMLDDSRIALDVFVQFDLFAAMKQYVIQDTVDFTLDGEQQEVDHLLFRLNITNGFPINGNMQIYFTDENFVVIDSLITENETTIIEGAPVSGPPLYKVTEPANEITDIYVDTERFNKVKKAKKILLRTELSTTNEQYIKVYTDYSMAIKVGIIAGLKINSNN
jgi:hypothetical protein